MGNNAREIYVYQCKRGWGVQAATALHDAGWAVRAFTETEQVPLGARVFFVPRHHPSERDKHKWMIARLASLGCHITPSPFEADIYDDKIKQALPLLPFLPQTRCYMAKRDAVKSLPMWRFPIFSKTSAGAGSHNVRYLRDLAAAEAEADLAFGRGIPLRGGDRQRGYVYWQAAVETDHDWRVLMLGRDRPFAMLVKRWNRADRPMASGSGNIEMVNDWTDADHVLAHYGRRVSQTAGLTFTGLDVVRSVGGYKTLECTLAWPEKNYFGARFWRFEGAEFQPTEYTGADLFRVIALLIGEGEI